MFILLQPIFQNSYTAPVLVVYWCLCLLGFQKTVLVRSMCICALFVENEGDICLQQRRYKLQGKSCMTGVAELALQFANEYAKMWLVLAVQTCVIYCYEFVLERTQTGTFSRNGLLEMTYVDLLQYHWTETNLSAAKETLWLMLVSSFVWCTHVHIKEFEKSVIIGLQCRKRKMICFSRDPSKSDQIGILSVTIFIMDISRICCLLASWLAKSLKFVSHVM